MRYKMKKYTCSCFETLASLDFIMNSFGFSMLHAVLNMGGTA